MLNVANLPKLELTLATPHGIVRDESSSSRDRNEKKQATQQIDVKGLNFKSLPPLSITQPGDNKALDFRSLVMPPPFEIKTVPISEVKATGTRGSHFSYDEHGQLLQSYVEITKFTKFLIDGYNYWVNHILVRQIISQKIYQDSGRKRISFAEVLPLAKPDYAQNGKSIPLTPLHALNNSRTYGTNIRAQIIYEQQDSVKGWIQVPGTKPEILTIGTIPVMLGSVLCHLDGLTPEKRFADYKIPQNDPLGYFIVEGVEKVVVGQDYQRLNRIILQMPKNDVPEARITNAADDSTVIMRVTVAQGLTTAQKKDEETSYSIHVPGEYVVSFKTLGQTEKKKPSYLNIFLLFKLFGELFPNEMGGHNFTGDDGLKNILTVMNMFAPRDPVLARQVRNQFLVTTNSFKAYSSHNLVRIIYINFMKKPDTATQDDMIKVVREKLLTDIAPHIKPYMKTENTQPALQKLFLIAKMAMQVAMCREGLQQFDNRDSFSIKRIRFAGSMTRQLFNAAFRFTINNATKKAAEGLMGFRSSYSTVDFDAIFRKSFITNEWGTPLKKMKDVAQVLKRESPIGTLDHLHTIDVGSLDKNSKEAKMRIVQGTQWELICPASTPDGDKCGITKKTAITAVTSLPSEPDFIIQILENEIKISPVPMMNATTQLLVNSIPLGWCNGETTRLFALQQRRNGRFPVMSEIVYDGTSLYIQSDGDILVRPVLILDDKGVLLVDKLGLRGRSFETCIKAGAVEYIGAWEEEWNVKRISRYDDMVGFNEQLEEAALYVVKKKLELKYASVQSRQSDQREGHEESKDDAMSQKIKRLTSEIESAELQLKRLNAIPRPTHCSMDPQAQFGISAALIPGLSSNPAPRVTYQANMAKSAMGAGLSNQSLRFGDTAVKSLVYPTRPLWKTQLTDVVGLDENPQGVQVNVAIMYWNGWGKEDAFIFNKRSVDSGMFDMWKETEYRSTAKISGANQESFKRPKSLKSEDPKSYRYIDENGLPAIHARLNSGDVVIGKIRSVGTEEVNLSERIKVGEEGIVTSVMQSTNEAAREVTIVVKMRIYRLPLRADKFAPRYAQKATVGVIVPSEDMPFDPMTGRQPDILVNPLAIIGRMTISYVLEIIISLIANMTGQRIDATVFRKPDMMTIADLLNSVGYPSSGKSILVDGQSGQEFRANILTGPCYFQALRHNVLDKIQSRGAGRRKVHNRQPPAGKADHGGTRSGEMERDAMISHGASGFLQDRLCGSSDKQTITMCSKCSIPAISTATGKYLPCRGCKTTEHLGILELPYSAIRFKNLLATTGIDWHLELQVKEDYELQRSRLAEAVARDELVDVDQDEDVEEEVAEGQEEDTSY